MAEGMVANKVAGFNSEVKTCSQNTQEGHGCIRMPSKLEDEVSGADLYVGVCVRSLGSYLYRTES